MESYAQEDTAIKKSFRDRFRSVVNSIYRESHQRQVPMVGQTEKGVYMEMGVVSLEQVRAQRKSVGNGDDNDDESNKSNISMPQLEVLTPREAIIRESISRNQVR